jgi:hypothetical protein
MPMPMSAPLFLAALSDIRRITANTNNIINLIDELD